MVMLVSCAEISLLDMITVKLPRNDLTEYPRALMHCRVAVLSLSINRLTSFPLFELPMTATALRMCHNLLTRSSFPAVELGVVGRFLEQVDPLDDELQRETHNEALVRARPLPRNTFPIGGKTRNSRLDVWPPPLFT